MPSEAVVLPEGTVTVLSTDLVGSTLLNQRLGDEAATALERADTVLQEAEEKSFRTRTWRVLAWRARAMPRETTKVRATTAAALARCWTRWRTASPIRICGRRSWRTPPSRR